MLIGPSIRGRQHARNRLVSGAVTRAATILGHVAHLVIRAAEKAGLDPAPLYRVVGFEGGKAPPNDLHLPIERYFELWERIVRDVSAPAFPAVVASMSRIEDNELFGFLAISCESLGEAFARTARYRVLYIQGARWELQQDHEATRLIWYGWPSDRSRVGPRAAAEFALADMCAAARQLSRTATNPLEIHIAHAPISDRDTAAFRDFFGVTPSFRAPLDELVWPPGVLATPIASFNSRLRDYFEEQCRELAARFSPDAPVAGRVRNELMAAMNGGDPSMEVVATKLGMSGRSLHRRLSEEGCRYNDLLDEIRLEFAKRYLARGTVTASEVAYLIGFQSPTAFFRAFKRWTGETPSTFRF